jgi:spoIIIJ-associated protein
VILSGIEGMKYAKPVGSVDEDGLDDTLTELADGMLARAGFPCRCETSPGEYRQVKVTTDDASAGMLIGRHGQTVDAVEHLVERMASNAIDARARINLDINNYRLRREEALVERVGEAAERIRETGRPFHMEPMSGRERRIVHLETASLGGLRTFTLDGSGGKHVVIALEEDEQGEPAEEAPAVEVESRVDDGVDSAEDPDRPII